MSLRRTVALAALVLAGCTKVGDTSAGAPTAGAASGARTNPWTVPHTLRIAEYQDISTLNPHIGTAISLGDIDQLTMAYLVRYGADNRPHPELATEVPTKKNGLIAADGRTITWHLRHDVKWSDGAPFDADDVVFSTQAVLNPKNNEVGRDGWDLITKIDEPDKYTVVYHLKRPYSGFLPSFFGSAGANPCILPKHLLGDLPDINNAPYNTKPIGIGPFRYVAWKRGESVELEPNPYYWRGQPKLKRVVFRFIPDRNTELNELTTGAVDLLAHGSNGLVRRYRAIASAITLARPGYSYSHIDFNTEHPALRDIAVRRALRMATNRPGIQQTVYFGTGISQESQVTPVSPLYTALPAVPYDIAGANKLLDDAGWRRGSDGIRAKNGVRLALDWATTAGTPDGDRLIEQVRSGWTQVGVSITVKHVAPALYFGPYASGGTLYRGTWDVTSFSWQMTPDIDFTPTNECDLIPPNGQNVTRLCDRQLDALMAQSKAAYDEDQRKPIVAAEERRVSELVPYYVLGIRDDIYVHNRDLRNWHPNNTTPFDDMLDVDI